MPSEAGQSLEDEEAIDDIWHPIGDGDDVDDDEERADDDHHQKPELCVNNNKIEKCL